METHAWRSAAAVLVIASSLTLSACGSDDDSSASVDEYCELVADLDKAGNVAFGSLGENPSKEETAEAFKAFFDENSDDIERFEEVTPSEIRDDVETLIQVQREASETGDLSGLETPASAKADERIQAYEDEHCPSGAKDDPEDRGQPEQ